MEGGVVLVTPKMLVQDMRHIRDRRERHKDQGFDSYERRHVKSKIRYA